MHADGEEAAGGVIATEDGAVFAATTHTYGAGGRDMMLVKYSVAGNEVWARTLGSTDDESARAIALAPDGGYVLVGERGTFIEGIQDLYVVKTDANGFSWMGRPFGASDLEESRDLQAPVARGSAPAPMNEESLDVGDDAPAVVAAAWFNVPEALTEVLKPNTELHAEDFGAKVLVVEFWATWCVPCKVSIPHINDLHESYSDDGVVFLSLTDEDASQAPVETAMRENAMATIVGSGSPSGFPFGAWSIPYAFVIDRYGKVLWAGHPMDEAFEAAIKAGVEAAQ
jgi:thiol-disulfide isomerase/thioredoxin